MTLNITIVSAGAVYQSTDFRLSVRDPGSRSYEPIKNRSQASYIYAPRLDSISCIRRNWLDA
jgi:hypothetical protein